jgi:hypothetical protein
MSLLKYRGNLSRNRPLTFVTPSIVSDTPQARAKVKRDLKAILRRAEGYLGREEFDQVVREHRGKRAGKKRDRALDKLLLDAWDAAVAENPAVTRTEVAKGFPKRYRQQSVRAVEKQLTRLLQARERERKFLAEWRQPSLLGSLLGTE